MSGVGDHYVHIAEVKYRDDLSPYVDLREAREALALNINAGASYYTVGRDGSKAPVESVAHNGTWYIKTKNDGSKADNLLSLPRYY